MPTGAVHAAGASTEPNFSKVRVDRLSRSRNAATAARRSLVSVAENSLRRAWGATVRRRGVIVSKKQRAPISAGRAAGARARIRATHATSSLPSTESFLVTLSG